MKIYDFIEILKGIAYENNIKLKLSKSRYVKSSDTKTGKSLGYFDCNPSDGYNGVLACSMLHPLSFNILVHESCHMDQFLEETTLWKKGEKYLYIFFSWLDGTEYSKHLIDKSYNITQLLELDCEQRAIRKIKKLKLDIDIDRYIKEANAYLYMYTYIYEHRIWYTPKKPVYRNKKIINLMPSKFLKSYKKLPPEIRKEFDKHFNI